MATVLLTNSLKFTQTLNEGIDIGTIQAAEVVSDEKKVSKLRAEVQVCRTRNDEKEGVWIVCW